MTGPKHLPRAEARADRLAASVAAVLVLGFAVNQAQAQASERPESPGEEAATAASSEPPSNVEIMRVTGRKVLALEAEVPASVTAFDAADIHALGMQNVADVSKFAPNVEIVTAGDTAASFFIRGVGLQDFSANAASAVAIYGDVIPLNSPALQLGGLFDLENVEIQRGPQGAGSGRNASAGAIRIHSRKPSGEIGGVIRASVGTYLSDDAHPGLIQTYEGAVETPIIEGVLASRFAFRLRDADPYMRNGCGDAPPMEDRPVFVSGRSKCSVPQPNGNRRLCFNDRTCAQFGEGTCEPTGTPRKDVQICHDEGFVNGETSRVPAGLPDYVGDKHDWAARGQFRFEPPVTTSSWLLNLHGGRLDQQSTLGQAIGTGGNGKEFGGGTSSGYREPDQTEEFDEITERLGADVPLAEREEVLGRNLAQNRPLDIRPYRGDYNRVGQTKLDTWGGFLSGSIEIGPVTVSTATGYDGYDRSRDTDADFTSDVMFELLFDDKAWQVSQELRVDGAFGDSFRWEAGGFYLQEELEAQNDLLVTVFQQPATIERDFQQDLWSFGVWAGFEWDFLDDLSVEAGVRYNWERKSFDITEDDTAIGASGAITSSSETQTWQAPTGLISLTYRFADSASAYWKYTRGFKAGTFNSNSADGEPPADAETIDAFETGMRASWLDERVTLRGAFFYYKYDNYQVFVFEDNPGRPPTLEIINANDAQVYGVEIDADIKPLEGWVPDLLDDLNLAVRFGWLESEYLDFTDTVLRLKGQSSIPVTVDFSGNALINSPRFQVSGTAEWPFDLGYWGTIIPRYDFTWSDDIYFNPAEGRGLPSLDTEPGPPVIDESGRLPEYAVGQKSFALHNLTLIYRPPEGNIEISGWVRNLLDERYKTYAFDASQFSKLVINFVGEPRTVGGDISIRW